MVCHKHGIFRSSRSTVLRGAARVHPHLFSLRDARGETAVSYRVHGRPRPSGAGGRNTRECPGLLSTVLL